MVSNIGKIIGEFSEQILKFSDDAYKQGWLIYLLVGLLVLFIILLFQRGTYIPEPDLLLNVTRNITKVG